MQTLIFLAIGLALVAGPFIVGDQLGMTQTSTWWSVGIGAIILAFVGIVLVVTRLYRRPSANQAYVKTGGRGAKVILDKGDLVFPVLHTLTEVRLETMRLDVKRVGQDALITKDNLRVDIASEFYIRVQPNPEDILQAARSLGQKSVQSEAVKNLVGEKLISALRAVAATKDLMELQSQRDEFAAAVLKNLSEDLRQNGLTLETVTISMLDQTPSDNLDPRNVFDAQGLRKITEITQSQAVQRNTIERDAERSIKEKDVETRKKVLDLDRLQAEAEAAQATEVANVQAVKQREREEYQINQRREVELAAVAKDQSVKTKEIAKNQAIQAADVDRERAVQTAMVAKEQAIQEAAVAKEQAVEIARRLKEIEIARKETERAMAEAETRAAEAKREEQNQRVETIKVTSTAERQAAEKMIKERQGIDIHKYQEQTSADIKAYELAKIAKGELEAAQQKKEATLILAEADAEAAKKRAMGSEAEMMVPVTVDREKVNVEAARVEVERQALQNKQEFSEAALKFEVQKLEISAAADVQKAFAESIGRMLAGAKMQIFGDPTTLSTMTSRFMNAAGWGQLVEGFRSSLPDGVRDKVDGVIDGATRAMTALASKADGQKADPAEMETKIRGIVENAIADATKPEQTGQTGDSPSKGESSSADGGRRRKNT